VTFESLAAVVEVRLGLGLGLGLGPGLGLGFGLAAAGLASALAVLAALSLAVFASLFAAMTGAAVMASTNRLDNQLLTFIDGVLLVPARLTPGSGHAAEPYCILAVAVKPLVQILSACEGFCEKWKEQPEG
jgi:hypothetical protein